MSFLIHSSSISQIALVSQESVANPPIFFILFSFVLLILFALFGAWTEFYQLEARRIDDPRLSQYYGRLWHKTQFVERLFAVLTGISLGMIWYSDFINMIFHLITFGTCFWILYDGFFNLFLGRNFFYVSSTSTSALEVFAYWYFKFPLLIAIILLWIFF